MHLPSADLSCRAPIGPSLDTREAQALLGGSFDYAMAKQQLEQAKKRARNLQHAGGTKGGGGSGTASAAARVDLGHLLPPPKTAWEVDEAWQDLDEYSKVGGTLAARHYTYAAATAAAAVVPELCCFKLLAPP